MKRSLYDSEYERVRRRAQPRAEFPEPDPDRNLARELSEDFSQRMAMLAQVEAKRVAEMKIRVDAAQLAHTRRVIADGYEKYGLEPPYQNDDGSAKFSLPFLLRLGWSIESLNGENMLVHPKGILHVEKEG